MKKLDEDAHCIKNWLDTHCFSA